MKKHLIKLIHRGLSIYDVVFFVCYMWFLLFLFSKLGFYVLLYFNLSVTSQHLFKIFSDHCFLHEQMMMNKKKKHLQIC